MKYRIGDEFLYLGCAKRIIVGVKNNNYLFKCWGISGNKYRGVSELTENYINKNYTLVKRKEDDEYNTLFI